MTLVPGLAADAVWWDHGRIRMVGSASELARRVPSSVPRYELPDTLVTPGFVDGHTHFAAWALNRRRVELAGISGRDGVLSRVAAGVPEQGWILGQGFDANGWDRPPDRLQLDPLHSGPVYLDSLDVHAAWVNSAALALAGIDRSTPDPFGGVIVRDANGDPTGLLLERAVDLVSTFVPAPGPDRTLRAVRDAQALAHRMGVTGIHDIEGPDALRAFRTMESAGDLALRVVFHPPVAQLPQLVEAGVRSGEGTEWLSLGGVKLFLDGSLGSRTAWMLAPYEDGRDCGMPITAGGDAAAAVRMAAEAGLACTIHAIGDAAVRLALDLLEQAPRVDLPHRIEHFQCIHPDDLARAARAGIAASMQPAHLLVDAPLAEARWGARSRGAYPFRTLLDHDTLILFGSDVPVATIDPREGVYAAMSRVPAGGAPGKAWFGEERITFEEAVRCYTQAPAVAAGLRDRRGTLATGQDADLVAWQVDPAVDADGGAAFREAGVALTVVGGRVVVQS
jgi:predicted amidohydrolase YtcJ